MQGPANTSATNTTASPTRRSALAYYLAGQLENQPYISWVTIFRGIVLFATPISPDTKKVSLQGWVCFHADEPVVSLTLDGGGGVKLPTTRIQESASRPCGKGNYLGRFNHTFHSGDFLIGKHSVSGYIQWAGGALSPMDNSPQCILNGETTAC